MRKHVWLSLPLAALMAFACACNPESTPSDGPDNPDTPVDPVETVYIDKLKSPDYAEITQENEQRYVTYYFDAENGNDRNDGKSEAKPKQTLVEANLLAQTVTADTPVKMLFKAGTTFEGTLTLKNFVANEETPLIVSSYAVTDENQYPVIAFGEDATGIEINASNVRVSGFEITSPDGARGINMTTVKAGAMKNIVVSDCYVHDINWNWDTKALGIADDATPETLTKMLNGDQVRTVCPDSDYGYGNGGIFCSSPTDSFQGASWLENVWIENNTIERVARSGMFLDSTWSRRPGHDWGNGKYCKDEETGIEYGYYPLRNFVIRGNDISYPGGDAIVLLSAHDSYIENNTSFHASYLGRGGYYNAGIWPHSCTNLVMQYNEASYTHLDNGCGDGQGFDIDIGNSDVIFQYNYSHHNAGGGILLCSVSSTELQYDKNGNFVLDEDGLPIRKEQNAPWHNNKLRNNVFADNDGPVVRFQATIGEVDFENNTVIIAGDKKDYKMFASVASGYMTCAKDWNIRNNIFYSRGQEDTIFDVNLCLTESCIVDNNNFYGFNDKFYETLENSTSFIGSNFHRLDPGFANVQTTAGLASAAAYMTNNAQLLQKGKLLPYMNSYDYSGEYIYETGYMGAFCKVKQ